MGREFLFAVYVVTKRREENRGEVNECCRPKAVIVGVSRPLR